MWAAVTKAAGAIYYMKRATHRLLLLALAAGAIISCDTRLPPASHRVVARGTPPVVVVDSPVVNTQVNLGDSIFLLLHPTGGTALPTLTLPAHALPGAQHPSTITLTPPL